MIAHSQLAPLPLEVPFRTVSKTIGQGAYACIKKAAPLDAPSPIFAVKFINKDYAVRHGGLTKKQLDLEINLHRYLGGHAHIVQFFDAGEDQNWRWIAMELAEGGDLFDKIESDVGVGEDIAHLYFLQLLSAVSYMHTKGIGHRDIKPENILLSAEGNLKIADFGLAVLFEYNGQKKLCTSSCGSPPYTAPEVVTCDHRMKKKLDQGYQGNLVDIWSCAVVLFVLLVGNTPWDEPLDRSYEFAQYVNSTETPDDDLWHKLPQNTVSLLRGMMHMEPSQRMSLTDIHHHPWVKRHNRHLNPRGTLENPIEVATQMFENLKVDFALDPKPSQRQNSPDGDAMDLDSPKKRVSGSQTQPDPPHNEIMFDWETPSQHEAGGGLHESTANIMSQQNLDEHLAEDPSCSQFSSVPRVPLTRTQFARQFRDILPSHSLTRFFSFWPLADLRASLLSGLQRFDVTNDESGMSLDMGVSSLTRTIKIRGMDSRNCPLTGTVMMTRFPAVEGNVVEVSFVKAKGDPLEWRRLFKKVVVSCKDAVFRPEDTTPLLSQTAGM